MPSALSTAVLWLFILNLGIAFGAGLYEHRIVMSRWIGEAPDSGTHWNAEAVRPTMIGLMNAPDSPQALAAAARWSNLNYLRHAFVLVAWLASLKAFALFYARRG